VLRLWLLLYLSRQVEKKELPSKEDYGVQLHVVDYNLECSFFDYHKDLQALGGTLPKDKEFRALGA